jgi:fucose 4-O-acetylase-like acetyltransferase
MKILKKAKQNLTYILFLALAGAYGLLPKLVLALATTDSKDPAIINCTNFKNSFFGVFDWVPEKYCTASGLAMFAIQTLINFSGVVAVLFLIVGGFFYLTSAGNEEQSEKGKKILINSVIGLVVIILASAIVRIIAGLVTGGQ